MPPIQFQLNPHYGLEEMASMAAILNSEWNNLAILISMSP